MTACSFFTISGIFGFRVLADKTWLWKSDEWSSNIDDTSLEADFKFFYLLYAARFISDFISIFYEDRRMVSPGCGDLIAFHFLAA
jgi:hypothetical protein